MTFVPASPTTPPTTRPTIVGGLFQQIAAAQPQFVIGTGDYMFASTSNAAGVDAQVALLLGAEAGFGGPIYHALGNHECTGATASNCPQFNETPNMRAFMTKLLPPGQSTPYYRIDVDTGAGKAKLVFIAANAWSQTQADWLEQQLADRPPTPSSSATRPARSPTPPAPSPPRRS